MNWANFKKYSLNCFLLTLPILLWNSLFAGQLPKAYQPEVFWNDIPTFVVFGEHTSRIAVFGLTFLMPLHISSTTQIRGIYLYLIGIIVYFASWLALIYFPESEWSKQVFGFAAPAYTPVIWLIAIAFIGNSFFFNWPYRRWIFISVSVVFLFFHNAHTVLIYERIH